MTLFDHFRRPLKDLRISVTDHCNYRCLYCMPLDDYVWFEKEELLTFEELTRVANVFVRLGVESIRLTGGEPLVRKDLHKLVQQLSTLQGLKDLSLTTNGALLAEKAGALKAAGLRRISISLDTLKPERFREITKKGNLEEVLAGIAAAQHAGFRPIKINTVIMRGVNDDEILDLADFARAQGLIIRFIEYMDVGNVTAWSLEKTVTKKEILQAIQSRYPVIETGRNANRAPAIEYHFEDGGKMGVIGSVTEPFCSTCSRARLTADGKMVTCLFATNGFDLKSMVRSGCSDEELTQTIIAVWSARVDRYSEQRWAAIASGAGYSPQNQKKIEMITLGG
ncbi:MAG: GTP 3',8-cyclase MoaA [Acidobacteria bacterium]|nr:GTP 3',8-cyclase MoaA [Acidobacteriota bacterium]